MDVPCPLSNLQATLYRRVCAAASNSGGAGAASSADSSAASAAAPWAFASAVDPLGFGEKNDGGAEGVDGDVMALSMDRLGPQLLSQEQSPQQHVPVVPLSGRQPMISWRGLKSLRALSQLCTHPCLAVQLPSASNKSTAPISAFQAHPRYQEW